MHLWSLLVGREAAMLAILVALGSGPASLLPAQTALASRLALAPVLGFCLGTCVTTTILEFFPANSTYWVLILLAAASPVLAAIRQRRARPRNASLRSRTLRLADVGALALIIVVVAAPLNVTLHAQNTVGPAAFTYTDGDTYVAIQDGARTVSLHAATATLNEHVATGAPFGNLTQYIYAAYAQVGQNLDAGPLAANVNALLGLGATDTYSPFLIVYLVMTALSAFAAVRYFARSPTLTATLAGCLFGGAMFLELWFDTYQPAIIAVGLILTFVVLGDQALRNERWASLVLVSLVAGTMLTVYPVYLIPMGLIGILMVAWRAWARHRSGGELSPWLRRAGIGLAAVLAMAAVFDPIGLLREIHFYPLLLDGKIVIPRVGYTLPPRVLPGWLTQTREFYALTGPGTGGLKEVLLGGLLPLLFLGIVVVGLLRYRQALTWVALI